MPAKATIQKRGSVTKVRTKRLKDGTMLRVYIYSRKKGTRGKAK